MQADYSYIRTTSGWGLPMATGTNPNNVQKGNRGTKQNPLSSLSSDFVLCELNTFEEPLSKEWMGTTAMTTFTLRLSTNPMKKTRALSSRLLVFGRARTFGTHACVYISGSVLPVEQSPANNNSNDVDPLLLLFRIFLNNMYMYMRVDE
jgi:hypothetical protein